MTLGLCLNCQGLHRTIAVAWFYDLELFWSHYGYSIVFVLLIGWINAFNFMDGVNGITVLYALTAIVSFLFCQ
jgi:UDP-N-acetylmuramyl pentapeptide phosphotransferase/UDP-N-acetylglucosamine-1-phosphate transferase